MLLKASTEASLVTAQVLAFYNSFQNHTIQHYKHVHISALEIQHTIPKTHVIYKNYIILKTVSHTFPSAHWVLMLNRSHSSSTSGDARGSTVS